MKSYEGSRIVNKIEIQGGKQAMQTLKVLEERLKRINSLMKGNTNFRQYEKVLKVQERIAKGTRSTSGFNQISNKGLRKDYEDWWKGQLKREDQYSKLWDNAEYRLRMKKRKADDEEDKFKLKRHENLLSSQKKIEDVRIKQSVSKLTQGSGVKWSASMFAKGEQMSSAEKSSIKSKEREKLKISNQIRGRWLEHRRIAKEGRFGNPEELKAYNAEFKRLAKSVKDGSRNITQFNQDVRQLHRDMKLAGKSTTSLNSKFKDLRNTFYAGGIAAAGAGAGSNVLRIGQDFQSMGASMLMVAGTSEKAQGLLKFVSDESKRLGLNLKFATEGFTKLGIASTNQISEEQTKELFTGLSEYATAVGADQFRFEKSMLAIQQMLNRTTITAEELKSQLSEHLPGSLQVFAKAAKTTPEELLKMVESGKLLAKDILPKVAKEFSKAARTGGALDAMLKSSRVEQGKLTIAFTEWKNLLFKSGYDAGMTTLFRTLKQLLEVTKPLAEFVGGFLNGVIKTVTFTFRALTSVILDLIDIFDINFKGSIVKTIGLISGLVAGMALVSIAFKAFIGFLALTGITTLLKFSTVLSLILAKIAAVIVMAASPILIPILAVAAAAAVGYGVGSLINKGIEGTSVSNAIGGGTAHLMAAMGSKEAQQAIQRNNVNVTLKYDSEEGRKLMKAEVDTGIQTKIFDSMRINTTN